LEGVSGTGRDSNPSKAANFAAPEPNKKTRRFFNEHTPKFHTTLVDRSFLIVRGSSPWIFPPPPATAAAFSTS
jgi:hypothetical protein